ncbi:MAG: glycosyltransferase [Candidatus Schekmanbacteria bacterium]|nr:glycosyltransferase [Candidatus Schekmanbacteria bacterium]
MRVALVHDWLVRMRGGEKVLEQMCYIYPHADVYTLLYKPDEISPVINGLTVRTSFIQKLPGGFGKYPWYLPLFPAAIEQFNLSPYDLVISSSHCVAKGVITRPGTCHISYIHTPMRYAWEMYYQYFEPERISKISQMIIPGLMSRLRVWDRVSADRVDFFIANSQYTAQRINKHYRRQAEVIYPPVATDYYTPDDKPRQDYYLIVSALVPYKRVDLAIMACNQLKIPLVVIGSGVEAKRLQAHASCYIKFLGYQDRELIREHYRTCRALLFPGEEDFGITPLEAMACGCPVIAYGAGGALETIKEPDSGLFFYEQTDHALIDAITRFEQMSFTAAHVRNGALAFSEQVFREKMADFVEDKYRQYRKGEHIPC